MSTRHEHGSTINALAWLVVHAAQHLDHVQRLFRDEATSLSDTLSRVAGGQAHVNPLGVLQQRGIQLDILAARRADAIEHLDVTVGTYRQAVAADRATPRLQPSHSPAQAAPPPQDRAGHTH
ncbi:hypothetical protein [Streptomyces sp. 8L]|uniref:hypothetical protein n=1 Tax=Streptomyces sp. 8L TaxID=2877242 RepID=UPI001CD3735E|nr:hypothetical protein [Streptomyces sp. 8L]MCA1223740.1 hypothetical protein [Streptomyces sp. 8L]